MEEEAEEAQVNENGNFAFPPHHKYEYDEKVLIFHSSWYKVAYVGG